MGDLKKHEQTAIEAVARRFSATLEKRSDPSDTCITIAGKRIAVDVATLKQHRPGQRNGAKPRLRFDKVVVRLMERLRANLSEIMPDGMTVLLTVTAPIRLASKTAAALEGKIQTLLGRRSGRQDQKETIHGNRVRIRLLRNVSLRGPKGRAPKMIGFVHNSDTDPVLILNMTRELLELLSAEVSRETARLARKRADERWLVVISGRESSCLDAYRYIYSQMGMTTDYKKVLMVFGNERVGALTE